MKIPQHDCRLLCICRVTYLRREIERFEVEIERSVTILSVLFQLRVSFSLRIVCCKKKSASTVDKVLNDLLDIIGLEMLEGVPAQNQIKTLFDMIFDNIMGFKSPVFVILEQFSMLLNVLVHNIISSEVNIRSVLEKCRHPRHVTTRRVKKTECSL